MPALLALSVSQRFRSPRAASCALVELELRCPNHLRTRIKVAHTNLAMLYHALTFRVATEVPTG
eukprot:6212664-Pleurochrysis_carterae.AAC.2